MESIVKMGVKPSADQIRNGREEAQAAVKSPAPDRASEAQARRDQAPASGSKEADAASSVPKAASAKGAEAAGNTGGKGYTEEEKALHRSRRIHYTMIARYVIFTAVICFVLLRAVDNLGPILSAVLKGIRTVGILLMPLFWGFVLAYILAPAVGFFEKKLRGTSLFRRKPARRHTAAVAITCVLALLVVVLLLSLAASALTSSLRIASVEDIVILFESFAAMLRSFNSTINEWLARLNISSKETAEAMKGISSFLAGLTKGLSSGITGAIGHIGGMLTSGLFAVIFSIYFLLDGKGLRRYWNRVLTAVGGKKTRHRFHLLAMDADAVFSGYIRGQLIDALIMAVLVSVALSLIGVKYAVIIGILSGIGNLIPYLGPVVAYGSTIIVTLLTGDWRRLLVAIVILFVIQTIDGNVINPRLLSSSIDVHPMLVIAALIIGGAVGGIVGMLFAVPVAAFLKIQFDKVIDRLVAARTAELAVPGGEKKRKRRKKAKQAS